MRKAGRILAVGCSLAMLTAMVSYGNVTGGTVRVSPRQGIPVVASTESSYADVAISHVSNYVNVRTEPNTTSSIVGKIYNNCAAKILGKVADGIRFSPVPSMDTSRQNILSQAPKRKKSPKKSAPFT